MTALGSDALARPRGSWAERQRRWWPGDLVRVLAFVSVPAAWWHAGIASGACLFLVSGGVMAIRLLDLRPVADIAAQLVLLVVAWAAVLGTYQAVPWLDAPAHLVGTAVATLVVWRGLDLSGHAPDGGRATDAFWLLCLAALLSVLWEVGEWLGHHLVSDEIGVGYDDTIVDLVWGTLGGLVVAALPARGRRVS